MHLAYDLAEGLDATILVDAVQRGTGSRAPSTSSSRNPAARGRRRGVARPGREQLFDPHGMQPDVVLGMTGMLGAEAGRVLVVGCEPASLEEGIGLSEPVAAAVDEAVRVVTGPGDERTGPAGPGGKPASERRVRHEGVITCASAYQVRWSSSSRTSPTWPGSTSAGSGG